MINRVGQRLLQLFEGASAAYSLRDLASNIASVVRVRRASDNSEKDFSAADVSSGAMTQWVNGQVVPPLDVRELVDGERTGDLVEASAAYSLRNLSTSYTGNVVDVRRSSDDAEESFTAAEVADGTLTDWVSEAVTAFTQTVDLNIPTSSGSYFTIPSYSVPNIVGKRYRVTFELKLNSGGAGSTGSNPRLRTSAAWAYSNATYSSNLTPKPNRFEVNQATGDYQTYTVTFTNGAGTVNSFLRFQSYDSDDSYTVRNFTTEIIGQDGFVTQWYDQSGNGNHATQTDAAKQPKIVDAGVFLGEVDFDGVDDYLQTNNSDLCNVDELSVFSVLKPHIAQSQVVAFSCGSVVAGSAGYGGWKLNVNGYVDQTQFQTQAMGNGGTTTLTNSVGENDTLVSYVADFPDASTFANGQAGSSSSSTISPNNSQISRRRFRIGCQYTYTVASFYTQPIKEIIIYNSDQSDNRTAFEANIGETYGIDLPSGVDTGYDQVDGFVETWYDQSGNGNDAVQQVSGKQPKIVDAGVLVSEGGKPAFNVDGVDDLLELGSAITNVGDFYVSLVSVMEETSGLQAILGADTNTDYLRAKDSTWLLYTGTGAGDTGNVGWSATFDSRYLMSFNRSGSTVTAQLNGSSAGTGTNGNDIGFITKLFQRGGNTTQLWKGNVQELIIYDTDQSANRPAIEANINNQYDIY
jgi:hypothetical protein